MSGTMEKEGGYMNRPPLLTGSANYDSWKSKMMAFLRSIDSKVWKVVLTGWEQPTYASKEGTSTGIVKPEVEWTTEEEAVANHNHKAIYALFNGVDTSVFKLIKNCVSAKDAWEILQKCYEGTTKVKQSKIQHLTSKFEALRMKDDESIQDFHLCILDIANSFEALGEKISDEKLSRKLLRSLPKRFDMKVTAIEEAHDISTMKMDELVGSLQTFEIVLNERSDKKNKSIAFVSNTDDSNDQSEEEEEDSLADAIAMLGKQFNKVLKRVGSRNQQNGQSIRLDINKQQHSMKKTNPEEKSNQSKGVQCHECEGYGHIRSECGTYQKRQKKGLTVSWSDEDTDEENESARHATALTGTCVEVEDWESDEDEDVSYEELASTYKELVTRYEEMCRILEKQKKTINKLQTEVNMQVEKATQAEEKVIQVNAQMDDLRKRVSQLNPGTNLLEEILDSVPSGKLKSVGYNYSNLNQYQQNPETKFTSSEEVFDPCTGKTMPKHQTQHSKAYPVPKFALDPKSSAHQRQRPFAHQRPNNQRRYRRWVCHHCGKRGHIRPFCYKLYGYPNQEHKPNMVQEESVVKKMWRPKEESAELPKEENVGLIAHTSLRASSREDWYFDSGCSRHMTGEEKYLMNVRSYKASSVTFGDGAKGEIVGIGDLINHGQPNLENVLLVKGLTANLISISQLCDQGMKVNFTKSECLVNNEEGQLVLRGTRSKDNCYLWMPQEEALTSTCLVTTEDEVQLWHQKMGHLNLKGMKKVISLEAIRGIPKLKIVEGKVCGECQIGKQVRMSHPMLEHQTTSKSLELLHMDLMGPMQVESLGGKRYVLVVVDDYSRYTWVNFIREKSDVFEVFKELCIQIQREKGSNVVRIRSDHGREFENSKFDEFCAAEGIKHEYSSPITPQQNGIVERLTQFLEEQEYRKRGSDKTLFVKEEKGKFIIAQIYVDDIVFGGMSNTMVQHFVRQMQSEFEMSLVGELTYFLGLQIKQMEDTIFISQSKYARNIIKKFGMDNAAHKRTPAPTHLKLTKDEKGISVDQSLYRSMIESLLYLTASRPDMTYAVGVCARYQADPKVSHLTQVKRILKYVNGTSDYGIMYSHCENSTLYGYCDADWAGSADDRKSTSGGCFFLGNNLISWFSKKQNCVALSTAEAEYVAAGSSCSQLVWMKQMLKEYDVEQDALTLYCDNMSAINISKNPVQHSKTKHIDIRHHYIRDLVESKIVVLEHVGTKEQIADIFTKALDAVQFEKLRGKLGICLHEEA
ncbi:putative mitochondrial protein [Trifolium repens]|nr:putative mitochondrial protein [Trifolium repens]